MANCESDINQLSWWTASHTQRQSIVAGRIWRHGVRTSLTLPPERRSPTRQVLKRAQKHAGSEIAAPQCLSSRGQCPDAPLIASGKNVLFPLLNDSPYTGSNKVPDANRRSCSEITRPANNDHVTTFCFHSLAHGSRHIHLTQPLTRRTSPNIRRRHCARDGFYESAVSEQRRCADCVCGGACAGNESLPPTPPR